MGRIDARIIATALMAAGLLLGTVAIVWADDETGRVEIKIEEPLDAVACQPVSPTITVLGLFPRW